MDEKYIQEDVQGLLDFLREDTDMFLDYCKQVRVFLVELDAIAPHDIDAEERHNEMIEDAFELFRKLIVPQLRLDGRIQVSLKPPKRPSGLMIDSIVFHVLQKVSTDEMEQYLDILGNLGDALQWAYLICNWDGCDFFQFKGIMKLEKKYKNKLKTIHENEEEFTDTTRKVGSRIAEFGRMDRNLLTIISEQVGKRPSPYRPRIVEHQYKHERTPNYHWDVDSRIVKGKLSIPRYD